MKTFLVTGCNGYIGSHMCVELRKHYPDCRILGIDMTDKPHLRHLYNDFVLMNLSRSTPDYPYQNIDCIFHFAALSNIPQGEQFKYTCYRNNIQSSINMIELANTHGIKNFIFSSSCSVYGDTLDIPLDEDQSRYPISVYAKTKAMMEDILLAAQDVKLLNVGILRYFNAAGRNVEANLFEDHEPETHLIPLLVKNDSIDIYGNDYATTDGTCVRDYIHVIDVCQAHISAYEYMEKNRRGIICNIGTGNPTTVLQVVRGVENLLNKKIKVNFAPRRPGDAASLMSDTTKMKKVLTFTPKYDIFDIINSMK